MEPVVYSAFRYYRIDPDDIEQVPAEPTPFLGGGLSRCVGIGIDEPPCQLVLEDFFSGAEYRWTTYIDQLDLVTEGSCEIRYMLAPAYEREETVVVEAPCIYLLPKGTRVVWKPLGDGPFRHISIDMPNPKFPVEDAASVKRAKLAAAGDGR
jgi:hypothetical protein